MGRLRAGLCSVTFRQLNVNEVIALVKEAGLECIEWGGDIHVPHGDLEKARAVQILMQEAGLRVAAYGSYYRVGESEEQGLSFTSIVETARTLAAPTIRVWAGTKGSNEADNAYVEQVVKDAKRIANLAQQENLTVSFEFHRNTLTDTNEATSELLKTCNHGNLFSFWQPPHFTSVEYRSNGLKQLLSRLSNIHIFYWPEPGTRRPLSEAEAEWINYLKLAKTSNLEHPVLLEFVEDDDPDAFRRDAKTLLNWLESLD